MRALVDLAVRRRVSVTMTALAVTAFGFVGYSRLSLELFPDISYPSITIQTAFPDTAPQEVEYLITRDVEDVVGVLPGLQTVHSVSRSGTSEVTLEFDWGSDMDYLSMEVREKLDRLNLPEEAEDPVVLRFDPSLDPIVRIALSSDGDLRELRYFGEQRLKQDLETLKGIASAQVKGGLEEEIQIEVDQERLAALGIPLARIRQVVEASNLNLPGGALRGEDRQYLIRTVNEFEDLEEIRRLIIWQDGPASVRLGEVANVFMGAKEREEITRVNGKESVEISIYKEGDANTVTVAKALWKRLDAWKPKLPPGYRLDALFDQSQFIEQAVNEVRNAAIIGGILAILVLFAFLRDFRSTLIIATSIPLSVIATFLCMYLLDISLNIVSLGGLTLGIGMLVDNSIVVLESIYRRRQQGMRIVRAVVDGTVEVGPAVIASTLTTVAVFLPIVFVKGIAGQLFKDQAMTVTISLLSSLVVAVTVIPMLSAVGRSGRALKTGREPVGVASTELATLGVVSRLYDRLVRAAIASRWLTLVIAFALFFGSVWSIRFVGRELIPPLSEGEFFFEVNLPEGTSLAATDRTIADLEDAARRDDIERYYSTVGSRLVSGGMTLNPRAENLGQLNIVMKDRTDGVGEARLADELRRRFADVPDLDIKLGRPSYFSLKTPIEVIIYGEELDELRTRSLALARAIEKVDGLVDVRSSLEAGNPEIQVVFDRQRLAALGVDMATASETLRNRVQGIVPTQFQESDRQIDIRVRNVEAARKTVDDVRNLVIPSTDGKLLDLLTVADVELGRGPAEIHRLKQQRAAVVTANLEGLSLGAAIQAVEAAIASTPSTQGVTIELGGQNREMQVSFNSLMQMLAFAVFMVYLVMAATFESFLHPFIVLFTIPLSIVGVVAGLLLTDTTISVIVLIGTIMLVGIVVNNAIVLIDTINRLRRRGEEKVAAVIRAGHIRLRPIVMTTLTTILGLLPMAISWGEGAELRAPLAITVAFGLALSTLLTLVVIPAVYVAVPSRVAPEENGDDTGDDPRGEVVAS